MDQLGRTAVVPRQAGEQLLVEPVDELSERARRVVANGGTENGPGDALVVLLAVVLRGEQPVDDRLGPASPAVDGFERAVLGVDACLLRGGEEGISGVEVGLAVDQVHVPAQPEQLGGEGQRGDGLAAAGLAQDQRLAKPHVGRRGDHGPAAAPDRPALDRAVDPQPDHRAVGWRRKLEAGHRPGDLDPRTAGVADLAVVTGGLVLVAVPDADLEDGPQRDASGAGEGEEAQERDWIERRAVADGPPHVGPGRPVRVPSPERHDTGSRAGAPEEPGPPPPPPLVDGEGERDGDHQCGADDDGDSGGEEHLGDEQVELVALVRGLTHGR